MLTVLAVVANLLALPGFARSLVTPTIRHELLAAVRQALEPAHASVWVSQR